MIFLDPSDGTWFGRLYLKGVGGIVDGVYDVRSGAFDQFVAVDEPASTALVGLALVGLIAARRSRVKGSA
jgi:MYXO-CTERM domain-containing protein